MGGLVVEENLKGEEMNDTKSFFRISIFCSHFFHLIFSVTR